MNFTDSIFLPFLTVVLILFYYLKRRSHIIIMLTIASYFFYCWWNVHFIFLILISSLIDYFAGSHIYNSRSKGKKRLFLLFSLCSNLGLLFVFKYSNFVIDNINFLITLIGLNVENLPNHDITLPVGISFYTFQTLSYTLDIYKGNLKPEKKITNFFFFVSAFPQLVAGPIMRSSSFLPQLHTDFKSKQDYSGFILIFYGLYKKLFLADLFGALVVDKVFANPGTFTSIELIFAAVCYSFQIFLDFSAYSDIAIGIGKLLGLDLMVNFRAPYVSRSIGEFWSRWHISLSTWFRDYLYIPLGGNRVTRYRHVFNLMTVFIISGLWHGANWTFIIWGALHGVYLVIEKFFPSLVGKPKKESGDTFSRRIVQTIIVNIFVIIGWIFFRSQTIADAGSYFAGISKCTFGITGGIITIFTVILLLVAIISHIIVETDVDILEKKVRSWPVIVHVLLVAIFFLLSYEMSLNRIAKKAFIYFQF